MPRLVPKRINLERYRGIHMLMIQKELKVTRWEEREVSTKVARI